MQPSVLQWELIGIPLVFFCGSALHFAYEWSGRLSAVAPFVPVNESIWEHLKLAYWPSVVYAALEYLAFGRGTEGFVAAKSAGILIMPLCIVVLFYGYTALLGRHILWLDILTFLVAVSVGQVTSYVLLAGGAQDERLGWIGMLAVALLGGCFAVFSFKPPRLAAFQDPVTGGYGLQRP